MYRCRCGKEYQSKTWFQNHRALCELLEDSKKDDIYDDLPSKIEMWNCMKVILKKYETLEKKMQDHEKYIKTQKKKINIIDWLTDNYKPELNYNEWLSNKRDNISTSTPYIHRVKGGDILISYMVSIDTLYIIYLY